MKKSELKSLIKEVITEMVPPYEDKHRRGAYVELRNHLNELFYMLDDVMKADKLTQVDKLKNFSESLSGLSEFAKKTLDNVISLDARIQNVKEGEEEKLGSSAYDREDAEELEKGTKSQFPTDTVKKK